MDEANIHLKTLSRVRGLNLLTSMPLCDSPLLISVHRPGDHPPGEQRQPDEERLQGQTEDVIKPLQRRC